MVYVGLKGESYSIENTPLGKGGEGSIFRIIGKPDLVLKLFNQDKRTETRHRKLLTMVKTPLSPNAMEQVTWPIDVVYENNRFIGYVMPLIKHVENLNVIYSDKYLCTLSERITIAKNLCAAVNAVHSAGQVCGDLNPNNIGVDPHTARITLVDTDSYHITDKAANRTYRCEVGLPEYLAKEIQDKLHINQGSTLVNLGLPTFTKETDLFALAVHIFALLMNGCHPYASAINNTSNINRLSVNQPSIVNPQPVDNIRNCFFPFYEKKPGFATPKYAPDFSALPPKIQALFVRAFVYGGNNPSLRPTAEQWYAALDDYRKQLKLCLKHKEHEYYASLSQCPWCELDAKVNQAQLAKTPRRSQTTLPSNPPTVRNVFSPQPAPVSNYPTFKNNSPQKSGFKNNLFSFIRSHKWFSLFIAYVVLVALSIPIALLAEHLPDIYALNDDQEISQTIATLNWLEQDYQITDNVRCYCPYYYDDYGAPLFQERSMDSARVGRTGETAFVVREVESGWGKTTINDKEVWVFFGWTSTLYSLDFVFSKDAIVEKDNVGNWIVTDIDGDSMTDYYGFASNQNGIWFFKKGMVDFDYTGQVPSYFTFEISHHTQIRKDVSFVVNHGKLEQIVLEDGTIVWSS